MRVGALLLRAVFAVFRRRPLENLELFETAREAVVARHVACGCKRGRDGFGVLAELCEGKRLEVAEHRILVAVAGGDRILERKRTFRRIRLFDGCLGERGVRQADDFVPGSDSEIVAYAFDKLLSLQAAVLLGERKRLGAGLPFTERLFDDAPVFERVATERLFLIGLCKLAPGGTLLRSRVGRVCKTAVDVRM